ncbi:MAG: right-handed parallel beta-helix repeat-containing protein [Armatimonadota bacterium]
MRFLLSIAACIILLVPAAASTPAADIFVATNGNDSWSGRTVSPNKDKTDGPFATIQRAQQAVRQIMNQPIDGRRGDVTVMVRGGTYYLSNPLTFTPADSGSGTISVVYSAYPGEAPVISGGRRITGWKKTSDGKWEVRIPEVASGAWNFSQLFVNGERRYRPRLPKQGYFVVEDAVEPTPGAKGKGFDRFKYAPGDIKGNWTNLNDVEVLPFHLWTLSRMRIGDIDEQNRIITFSNHTLADTFWASLPKGNRYLIDNVKEALDEAGEWYLDRKTGVLTYIPMKGEDIRKAVVIAPVLDIPVSIKGDLENRKWVSNITFKGLSFMHSNWNLPVGGYSSPQGEFSLPGLIYAEGARNIVFDNCTVAHTGGQAIDFEAGCKFNKVQNCEITDLGAGGIKVGEGFYRTDNELLTSYTTVRNNVIAHGGRLHPAGEGVLVAGSPYNQVLNNDIFDFYYTGINVGWSWGYGPSNAHHNRVENNHVYNIGQGVLSDMGGIYTLGIADGSVIRHNLFHDIMSYSYGGWGIYLDEGTTHMLVEDNVVYRTKTGGFHQHYGKENTIRNNIFAFAREGQVIRTRSEEHKSFDFERNIVVWKDGPLLGSNWSSDNYKLDYNLYWNTGKRPINFAGMDLSEWQKKGQDVHSIIADPGFVDISKDDYRLRPDSSALKIGFKPIAMTGFGSSNVTRRIPESKAPAKAFPYAQPASDISENFEGISAGSSSIPGLTVSQENDQASVKVVDNVAASGKHSLQFADMPGQKYNFNPHAFYVFNLNGGMINLKFKLRVERGAEFWHEWRNGTEKYAAGPSISVEDGKLLAGKDTIADIPYDKWVTFDITCGIGGDSTGSYDMKVTVPGKSKPLSFKNLPCDPKFDVLRWIGFVSNSETSSKFYIDDISFTQTTKD